MRVRILSLLLLACALSACASDKPERIKADEELPQSPCACGPQVRPLLWDAA